MNYVSLVFKLTKTILHLKRCQLDLVMVVVEDEDNDKMVIRDRLTNVVLVQSEKFRLLSEQLNYPIGAETFGRWCFLAYVSVVSVALRSKIKSDFTTTSKSRSLVSALRRPYPPLRQHA